MERIDTTVATRTGATTAASGGDEDEVDLIPVRTYWMLVRQRFLQHRLAVMALFLMAFLVAIAIIVPTLTGDAYTKTSLSKAMQPPSLSMPLGTNQIGQDMFLRLMKALQTSLFIGFMSVVIIGLIGVTLGALAGYYGGWVDNVIMRFVDVILSLPVFFMILIIVAVLGKGSALVVVIAIGLTGWTLACRLVRAEFLKLREADFVQAARALGASNRRIIARHILPAALAPVVVAATLGIADSVVAEASLSFLGFGISPPEASLGNLLKNFEEDIQVRAHLLVPPSVTIVLVVLAASFLGDGLRDALDPRQRVESK
ncbi:MAG: peptide/nickel transport system permease protein [Chloroflexota bacterium]|jgi:peptide/nickel transport system permease protein|nr:peptide/nickel transport system permease protein [Chloroflexota bacterium]MEA2613045.1 peptide/nickel transport system permease protein [Chloroflexota bacterium]